MKFSIILILIFISSGLSAQVENNSTPPKQGSRFSIGIVASPDYFYRQLTLKKNPSANTTQYLQFREAAEIPKWGYTFGLNVSYDINKKFSIESGINYSNKGFRIDLSGLTFGDFIDPRYGFIYQSSEVTANSAAYSFNYLDIPLKLVYISNGKKIQFTSETGIVLNFFISAYEKIGSARIDLTKEYEKAGVSGFAAVGATFKCSSKFRIKFLPAFQYSLYNLSESSINEHLFSLGFQTGGYLHF